MPLPTTMKYITFKIEKMNFISVDLLLSVPSHDFFSSDFFYDLRSCFAHHSTAGIQLVSRVPRKVKYEYIISLSNVDMR